MNPRRFTKTFMPQFAPLVESGNKRQTFRPTPKRMPHAGDIIDCREWTGVPYRSKQRKLGEHIITRVVNGIVDSKGVTLCNRRIVGLGLSKFAEADGFASWSEMREWFLKQHGLPFNGILLMW